MGRPDPAAYVHGVVAVDRGEVIFAYGQLATSATEKPALVRLAGLADDQSYRVPAVTLAGGPDSQQIRGPGWVLDGGCTLAGRVVTTVGLPAPVLRPERALLLHVVAG